MPYCSVVFPMFFIMAAASSPSRPEMTSFWVVLLMIFFVELYTMVSRRLSALEMEEFRVWANFRGSLICHKM